MSNDIISILSTIPDREPASVTFTSSTGRKTLISCVFKTSDPPSFFLLFSPGTIPEDIKKGSLCLCDSHDAKGKHVTFDAEIIKHPNNRVVEFTAKKTIKPEDLREYFRVNITANVEVFYDPEESSVDEQPLELDGKTVDISQSGVLTILSNECTTKKPVSIELNLPNPEETIICAGSVVLSKRLRKNRWLTSFHFDNISSKSKDIIAKNCFAEQRRQLRENIQTSG